MVIRNLGRQLANYDEYIITGTAKGRGLKN